MLEFREICSKQKHYIQPETLIRVRVTEHNTILYMWLGIFYWNKMYEMENHLCAIPFSKWIQKQWTDDNEWNYFRIVCSFTRYSRGKSTIHIKYYGMDILEWDICVDSLLQINTTIYYLSIEWDLRWDWSDIYSLLIHLKRNSFFFFFPFFSFRWCH